MTKTTTANLSENLVHADDALRVSEANIPSLSSYLSPVAVYLLDGAAISSANAAGAQTLKNSAQEIVDQHPPTYLRGLPRTVGRSKQ